MQGEQEVEKGMSARSLEITGRLPHDDVVEETRSRQSEWSILSNLPFQWHKPHWTHLRITSGLIIRAASVIGWNALFMFFSEVIIEILILVEVLPKIPFRLDFFALTTISALLGYQTLMGVAKRELDVTRNSLVLAAFVEGFLIIGDIQFILDNKSSRLRLIVRGPFIGLTFVNFVLVLWMYSELHTSFEPDWPKLFDVLFLKRRGDDEGEPANEVEPFSGEEEEKKNSANISGSSTSL